MPLFIFKFLPKNRQKIGMYLARKTKNLVLCFTTSL
nr:MAG TPA_asm: hypothetical protein [Caudoviricetes sp.]